MWTFLLLWLTHRRLSPAMSGTPTEREMLSWQIIEDKGSHWLLDSANNFCNIKWSKTRNGTWSALPMTLWHSNGWLKRLSCAIRRTNNLSQQCTTKNLVFTHSDNTRCPTHSGTSGSIKMWTPEKRLAWLDNIRYLLIMWHRSYTLKTSLHWQMQNSYSYARTPKRANFPTISWGREATNMEI